MQRRSAQATATTNSAVDSLAGVVLLCHQMGWDRAHVLDQAVLATFERVQDPPEPRS